MVLPHVPLCLSSWHFTTREVEYNSFQPPNPRMRDTMGFLIQWSSHDLYPMTILASRDFATSRLGAPNSWALTLRTSEFARSLDLCHLSSSDGWLPFSHNFDACEVEKLLSLTPDVRIPGREDLVTCVLPIGRLRFFHGFATLGLSRQKSRPLIL
jgi:hypothetical protein